MARHPQTTEAEHPTISEGERELENGRDYLDPEDAASRPQERGVARHREESDDADEEELADEDLQDRELDDDFDVREGDGPDA